MRASLGVCEACRSATLMSSERWGGQRARQRPKRIKTREVRDEGEVEDMHRYAPKAALDESSVTWHVRTQGRVDAAVSGI